MTLPLRNFFVFFFSFSPFSTLLSFGAIAATNYLLPTLFPSCFLDDFSEEPRNLWDAAVLPIYRYPTPISSHRTFHFSSTHPRRFFVNCGASATGQPVLYTCAAADEWYPPKRSFPPSDVSNKRLFEISRRRCCCYAATDSRTGEE